MQRSTLVLLAILTATACDPVYYIRGQVSVEPTAFTIDDGPVEVLVLPQLSYEEVFVTVLCAPPDGPAVFEFEHSDIGCVEESQLFAELRPVTLQQDCASLDDSELQSARVRSGEVLATSNSVEIFTGRSADKKCNSPENAEDIELLIQ